MTETLFDAEKRELDIIIGRGVSFEVEQTYFKRRPGLFGIFQKRIKVSETVKYTIKEPTLAVLDHISAQQVELGIDEKNVESYGTNEAKKLAAKHSKRMARILAIAVLGEDYFMQVQKGNSFKYVTDDKALERLENIFLMNVKPSKLIQLSLLISTMENLGDFMNSIRLMSASRTMMPIRIEEKQKD
jgi:hypothetical protein